MKHTEETKQKIRLKILGLKRSEETKRKISQNKDRALKISKALTGRVLNDNWRKNISIHHHNVSGPSNPMYGKHHTEQARLKQSQRRKDWEEKHKGHQTGEKNPCWNGGSSFKPYLPEFNYELKKKIKSIYNNKCFICKRADKQLVIHHIEYNVSKNKIDDLVPLCRRCHSMTNSRRKFWKVYFQNKNMSLGEIVMKALTEPQFFEVN